MPRLLPKPYAAAIGSLVALFALVVPLQPALADFLESAKLVGTGATGASRQGKSVALSADGNTLLVGAHSDASSTGAAWVFVRNNGVWTQQGGKLLGAGAAGAANQGQSVALSADGNTAIIGGYSDNSFIGAAWIFVRSNGVWSPQGGKLVGTGAVGAPEQGVAVALSADGNTALVGGYADNSRLGAAWVFTRNGETWTQQGSKLVGVGGVGAPYQGWSVALSGDGNTALIGGKNDSNGIGAAWVFNRNAGTWSQFGNKLVGTGAAGTPNQGFSVALSADGKTALLGGVGDATCVGAAWVFTFNGSAWTQQGGKLVGTGAEGSACQGWSVGLSGDGDTAIVGGNSDASGVGAAWVFGRSNGTWSQQGGKLVGFQPVGGPQQGTAVALSADGSTAVVGGILDNASIGAAWVWLRHVPHDLNGDGKSDIVWRNSDGTVAAWTMSGAQVIQGGTLGVVPGNWQIVGQRRMNLDEKSDLLWRDTSSGALSVWLMNVFQVSQASNLGAVPTNWKVEGIGDFTFDRFGDIVWRDTSSGTVALWYTNGAQVIENQSLGAVPLDWSIVGTSGKTDIFWRHSNTGTLAMWRVRRFFFEPSINQFTYGSVPANWAVVGISDFDGNGMADILWRDSVSGTVAIWLLSADGSSVMQSGSLGAVGNTWSIAQTGDYNGDGKGDILWRDTSGNTAVWFMKGISVASSANVGNVPTTWVVQNTNAN
jgi:hypothetical protein